MSPQSLSRSLPLTLGVILGLLVLIMILPGWAETLPTWRDFATMMRSWEKGKPLERADALFDTLDASGMQPDRSDLETIDGIFQLAQGHRDQKNLERSERLATQAFRWLEGLFGPDDMILVTPLMDLSAIWHEKGEDARAVQALNRGLRIIHKDYGPSHVFAAELHERLAQIYRTAGKNGLARPHERSVYAIWKKNVAPNTIASVFLEKDEILQLWRDGDQTSKTNASTQAKSILELAPEPYQEARVALILALVQNDETIPSEEKNTLLTDALATSEELKGDHHPGLVPVILALARFHQTQGKTDLALPLLYRALNLVEEFFGPGHLGTAHIYVYLAENLSLENKDDEALPLYDRAAAIFRSNAPTQNQSLAQILPVQVALCKKLNKWIQAEQAQMEYLTLLSTQITPSPPADLLDQARQAHKELVRVLLQQAGVVQDPESMKFQPLVALLQQRLVRTGFDPGPTDGFMGEKTIQSIRMYEKRLGLPESQTINPKVLIRILEHLPP
ncbi:MAG: tetratricopeptide repeat protein [Magnetococcales bacterium]|nr:tetratricopeptide repeat protein [Magnetococcales bacterium]